MGRSEQRIFQINDEIEAARRELYLVEEELTFHRHLDDDARRDAAVSGHPMDRADARETTGDVARFERSRERLQERIAKLEAKRDKLLRRL